MRKVAMAMAVLALAGCGEGKPVDTPKAKPAATESQPQTGAIAAQEWDLRVGPPDHKLQAITDLTAWLLEHGFNFYIVKVDGKDEVLLGPFATRAEAGGQADAAERKNGPRQEKRHRLRNYRAQGRAVTGRLGGGAAHVQPQALRFTGPTNSLPRPITHATV